jgi:hypothetical protein
MKSCKFYSRIPGFRLVYGGSPNDSFTTYEFGGSEPKNSPNTYLNLELARLIGTDYNIDDRSKHFGRIIIHTDDVDKLCSYLKNNQDLSNAIIIEGEPKDAP